MKKPKHIADQYEFNMGDRPFRPLDKVVVSPDAEHGVLESVTPVLQPFHGIVCEALPSFLVVKDEKTGTMYSVYPRQCTLRK
jgi:hypothetical protein